MKSKSRIYKNKESSYKVEKRKYKRSEFSQAIYYPRVNYKSFDNNNKENIPVFKVLNIGQGGVAVDSAVLLQKGDVLNFLIKIEDNPSFQCMGIVKWIGFDDDRFIAGCEFMMLNMKQIQSIKDYVNFSLLIEKE